MRGFKCVTTIHYEYKPNFNIDLSSVQPQVTPLQQFYYGWHTPILGGIARNILNISLVQFLCTICTARL